jgi:hypothetical protein
LRDNLADLKPEEAAVLALLESRLKKTTKDKFADSVAHLERATRASRRKSPKAVA